MSKIPKAAWPREYATRTMLSLPARIEGWKFQFESLAEVSDCSAEKRTAPGARVSYHNCLITGPDPLGVVLSLTHASQRVPSFPTEAVGNAPLRAVGSSNATAGHGRENPTTLLVGQYSCECRE